MAVEIFHEGGRWVARCGHCGGALTGHQDQEKLEGALRARGAGAGRGRQRAGDRRRRTRPVQGRHPVTAGPGALYLDYFLATDGRPGPGAVYVLHFLEPIGNLANRRAMARHYIGWSPDPPKRIARHTAGQGAAIVRAVQARGIGFTVAVVWPGDRRLERKPQAPP